MRVCYFWAAEWPEARRLLTEHAPEAVPVWTGENPYSYWHAYDAEWNGNAGEDLVTIEQDIGIHGDVLPQFRDCPEPWCAFGYQVASYTCIYGNGCSKYSRELRAEVRTDLILPLVPDIGECADCAAYCWRHLDSAVSAELMRRGYQPHVHTPDVRHLRMELFKTIS